MEVGHLERVENDGKPVVFMGEINMQNIAGEIFLGPRLARTENSPGYDVKLKVPGRDWVPVGAAWVKKFKDGSGEFFSMTLDHPGLAQPIYVSAFPDEEGKQPKDVKDPINFTIQWGRARSTAPVVGDPVGNSDSIPY